MNSLKKCYLDSNVLVYLKDENSPHHKATKQLVKDLSPDKYTIYVSSLTIDEFIHAAGFILKQRKLSDQQKYRTLDKELGAILSLSHLQIVNPSTDKSENKEVILIMRDYNLSPRDAYHLLIMQEQKINYFATFDTDFKKVFKSGKIKSILNRKV